MLVLDFDGTIISCEERQCVLMRDIIDVDFDVERYWLYKRCGDNNKEALIKLGYSSDKVEAFCKKWLMKIESLEYLKLDRLLIDLTGLSKINDLVLLTARRNKKQLYWQLQYLNILDCFKKIYIVDPRDAVNEKSNILKQIHCEIYIGDTESDFEAANLAGVSFKGVCSGQRNAKYWSNTTIKSNMLYPNLASI